MSRLLAVSGDITQETTDAIVNAANSSLAQAGSLRRNPHGSWPRVSQGLRRTRRLPDRRCPDYPGIRPQGRPCDSCRRPGLARWRQGRTGRFGQLLPAVNRAGGRVRASIHRIPRHQHRIYGYPLDQATEIAVRTVRDTVRTHPNLELVRFVCFSETDLHEYQKVLSETS